MKIRPRPNPAAGPQVSAVRLGLWLGIGVATSLEGQTALKIQWGVMLLFGGGLVMAAAMADTGLASRMGNALGILLSGPVPVLLFVLVTFVIFATGLISHVATASALLPVVASLALTGNMDPILLFLPVAMAASCAFMLPIATGPNAIAFSTGAMTIPQMARIGLTLNGLGCVLITVVIYWLAPLIM